MLLPAEAHSASTAREKELAAAHEAATAVAEAETEREQEALRAEIEGLHAGAHAGALTDRQERDALSAEKVRSPRTRSPHTGER